MKLTTKIIEKSTAKAKLYRLTDGKGMYLLITKSGSKLWRLDYTLNNKRNTHALGVFPDVTLIEARALLSEAKKLISDGIDPNLYRKLKNDNLEKTTFEAIALQWHTKFSLNWSKEHSQRIFRRLEKDVFPWIGARQIKEITSGQLLSVIERTADRGALETAHRIHQNCGAIFRYAIATDRATNDITLALKGSIPPVKTKHHPVMV
ncbi:MAG: integrase arm-type DNA-binding domain-containing protein [Verrucomicrobiales bacterium]